MRALLKEQEIPLKTGGCTDAFWELAEQFPEELILWCEEDFYEDLDTRNFVQVFQHDHIMASYSLQSQFLPNSIGYVDQLPFVNINKAVRYPSWRMSRDIGGIKGETLLKFRPLFKNIRNFEYLLNSVAKVGQQNGLFCYSDPGLLKKNIENEHRATARTSQLFSFVYQHYNSIWVYVLLFCYMKYEKEFPIGAFLQAVVKRKFFREEIDLSDIELGILRKKSTDKSIDVIIPTIGRAKYLQQVLHDLSEQSLLPKRVIIIEQNPEQGGKTELGYLLERDWPFEVMHQFARKTGACMARNKAIKMINAEWTFFADDDIRLPKGVLENTLAEAGRLSVGCINLNCRQPGEPTVFHKIKQWGSFGSGTSMVLSYFAQKNKFSEEFEHGYGEDADFGMKLRASGCDIIYHPELEIKHLKAPTGGFRRKPVLEWEKEDPQPKPSPTVMLLAKKYFSEEQIRGFKISLFLKFYSKQKDRNPLSYVQEMKKRWRRSEYWADKLSTSSMEVKNHQERDK